MITLTETEQNAIHKVLTKVFFQYRCTDCGSETSEHLDFCIFGKIIKRIELDENKFYSRSRLEKTD